MQKLKKLLAVLVCMAMALTFVPGLTVWAYEETADGLEYEVYNDHVEITGYSGGAAKLSIPAEIGGLPVSIIGSGAFKNCTSLTGIDMPVGITAIDSYAFYGCANLMSVDIPSSVFTIGNYAFGECYNLADITMTASIKELGTGVFVECTSLNEIIIPYSLSIIPQVTFYGCKNLTTVYIPENIYKIEVSAFGNCYNLSDVYYSGSAEKWNNIDIGGSNDSLLNAHINVESIDPTPEIPIEFEYEVYDDYVEITDCTGSEKEIFIPATIEGKPVTSIGYGAFSGLERSISIDLPNSVTSIGEDAFYGCTSLESIDLPNGVTSIGESAFRSCTSLESIDIPKSVISIGENAFYETAVYNDVSNWTDGGLYLGNHFISADYEATGDFHILDGTIDIAGGAMAYCTDIENIYIPESVEFISAEHAFVMTGTNIFVDENNKNFLSYDGVLFNQDFDTLLAYPYKHGETYIIPDGVFSIAHGVFESDGYQIGVKNLILPEGFTEIEGGAFWNSPIENLYLPLSLKHIGHNAFFNMWNYGDLNFYYAGNEEQWADVEIEADVLGRIFEAKIHFNSSGIVLPEQIPEGLEYYVSDDYAEVTDYTGDSAELTIPAEIEGLPVKDVQIYGNESLTSLTVPEGVISISGLSDCPLLEEINLPASVENISVSLNNTAYYNDESNWYEDGLYLNGFLVAARGEISGAFAIKDGTVGIGGNVFSNQYDLTQIDLPNTVRYIGEGAFSNSGLAEIVIPDGVQDICSSAFYGCNGLSEIYLPDSVKSIWRDAFEDCRNLVSVSAPATLRFIGSSAFSGCSSLKEFKLRTAADIQALDAARIMADEPITIVDVSGYINHIIVRRGTSFDDLELPNTVTLISESGDEYSAEVEWNRDSYDSETTKSQTIEGRIIYSPEQFVFDGISDVISVRVRRRTAASGPSYMDDRMAANIASIGEMAFNDCTELISVDIARDVTAIDGSAFWGCDSLTDVYYKGTKAEWDKIEGKDCLDGIIVHCIDYEPVPEIKTPEITVDNDADVIEVYVETENLPQNVALITISYGGNGEFIETNEVYDGYASLSAEGVKTVKVFCWESLESMRPICEAKEVEVIQ